MLTLGRLVLTIVFLGMILYAPGLAAAQKPFFLDVAFVLFIITALTDIADGKIARKYNITSKFGRIVDPLADKCLVCGAFVCFAIIGEPVLFGWPKNILIIAQWSVVGIIIARDLYVTILRHIAETCGINFGAVLSGKIKVFLQFFTIGTIIIRMAHVQDAMWGYWFTAITLAITLTVTIISGLTYLIRWQKCKP